MPVAPLKPCASPGCPALTDKRHCPAHTRQKNVARGGANAQGYTYQWQQARKTFLRANPLCVCGECQGGVLRVTAATVVDHIVPHRGNMALFWDVSNWQAMAKPCHDRKTATEDGGFGRSA